MTGKKLFYVAEAHFNGMLAGSVGDGPFTKKCHAWAEKEPEKQKALLTNFFTQQLYKW